MSRPYPSTFPSQEIMAATALHRFGYGPRPGEIRRVARDPRGWLRAQLDPALPDPPELRDLPDSAALAGEEIGVHAGNADMQMPLSYGPAALDELAAHLKPSLSGPAPFRERLVRFWAHYFRIPSQTLADIRLALAFERDVIRPHMFSTPSRLFVAALKHPAFLIRFNHLTSIGRNSDVGIVANPTPSLTLPEHIVTQLAPNGDSAAMPDDIRALASMMTGWSIAASGETGAGQFVFREDWHEPGAKLFRNRRYPEAGVFQAEAAIDSLFALRSTINVVAFRMAHVLLGQTPNPEIVAAMVRTYLDEGGLLSGLVHGFLARDEVWDPEPRTVKSPLELVLSLARALDLGAESTSHLVHAMRALGQTPHLTETGAAWSASSESWLAPELFVERLEWVAAMAQQNKGAAVDMTIADLALDLLSARLDPGTHRRLLVTTDRGEGLGLMLAGPGFQRR